MTAPAAGLRSRWASLDARTAGVGALAGAVVVAGLLLGWRGVDLPAQLYRVGLFRRQGFALWDSQWFGGHWLLDYSVLFPAVAASIGVGLVTVLAAVTATLAFDRLVVWELGNRARAASVVFALGVAVQSSIGQLTFLAGEAAGLWCLVALARRRWTLAAGGAALATLASPLAGAFVALAVAAVWVANSGLAKRWPPAPREAAGRWPWLRRAVLPAGGGKVAGGYLAVLAAAAVPVGVTSLLFPGQGPMPYPFTDYLWECVVAAAVWTAVPRDQAALRAGAVLFVVAATLSEVIATPLGGNIGRLEDLVAFPLVVAGLWPRTAPSTPPSPVASSESAPPAVSQHPRRTAPSSRPAWLPVAGALMGRRRVVLAVLAVPLLLSQWAPAWAAMTSNPGRPWTHAAYYQPLSSYLSHRPGPPGRTEVVPTADHWETAYVAPSVPLARGWERQLDVADNPIFYTPGALTASSYRAWLLDNGVRWVALSSAPLDAAGTAEAALVERGVPGLRPVWHRGGWSVYQVLGSAGIVGAGGRLVHLDGSRLSVAVTAPGPVVVRVRWSPAWQVEAGAATLSEAPGRWLLLDAASPGLVELRLHLL
ncbi:hypothetical protein K6U06_04455 [Acidiferrimicrobium sp. IK]|uniref:hypothetical protein n=1 Tax=Acidiferrimicrobium sp. IK TaxID=2871700 RepID=UPI0021CB2DA2|nr:hypothetical protein [Acidiferrimicrobium sp. IK]MCU4183599.1 hypothetical protein [Acidiferrimicrobium sp. IK]